MNTIGGFALWIRCCRRRHRCRRPLPAAPDGVTVRALRNADLDAAIGLALELARWNTQFGGRLPRPSTEQRYRRIFGGRLTWPAPWVWVTESAGTLTGMIVANPP